MHLRSLFQSDICSVVEHDGGWEVTGGNEPPHQFASEAAAVRCGARRARSRQLLLSVTTADGSSHGQVDYRLGSRLGRIRPVRPSSNR